MGYWPSKTSEKLNWAKTHRGYFTGNAAAIGISAAQAAAFAARTEAALEAVNAYQQAKLDAEAKAAEQQAQIADLYRLAGEIVAAVHAKALADDSTEPYLLAGLSVPGTSGPIPHPAVPTNLSARLDSQGFAIVGWSGTKASTTYWSVWRRLPDEEAFTMLGVTESRSFADDSIPAGAPWASYRVQAHRGSKKSAASEAVQIVFGALQQAA